jgi:hypothetical protein
MMTQILVWLNTLANAAASFALAPLAVLPGWLSATLVAVVTGGLMLLVFKVTSHQTAIRRVRSQIKANLLALSLFQDSVAVSLRSQARLLLAAGHLLLLSLVPLLVMLVPMCLLLAQLALWYQARPLQVGEQAVVTLRVADDEHSRLPDVRLVPSSAFETTVGPVRVPAKNLICWNIRAQQPGHHPMAFETDGQTCVKELTVGDGFMPVSLVRPPESWGQMLLHPREAPLADDSVIQAIEIDYPNRQSWTSGSNSWLVYCFAVSMLAALLLRPVLRVHI